MLLEQVPLMHISCAARAACTEKMSLVFARPAQFASIGMLPYFKAALRWSGVYMGPYVNHHIEGCC